MRDFEFEFELCFSADNAAKMQNLQNRVFQFVTCHTFETCEPDVAYLENVNVYELISDMESEGYFSAFGWRASGTYEQFAEAKARVEERVKQSLAILATH